MIRRSVLLVMLGCACASTGRAERISKLSPDATQQFAKYKQFMTEHQLDAFLNAESDLGRTQIVESLKVDEMLSQFPKPVQDAIWGQQVMLGMSRAAVLLSWGGPRTREFDDDQLSRGNEVERWWYQRNDKNAYVVFTNGFVSDYDDGSKP